MRLEKMRLFGGVEVKWSNCAWLRSWAPPSRCTESRFPGIVISECLNLSVIVVFSVVPCVATFSIMITENRKECIGYGCGATREYW